MGSFDNIRQMNALWLNRLSAYKYSVLAISTSTIIINLKITKQNLLIHKYKRLKFPTVSGSFKNVQDLSLMEARAAKYFWSQFRVLLPKANFPGRSPRSGDIVNKLLDIGYHHLAGKVKKILMKYLPH